MTQLIVQDLEVSAELDSQALVAIQGGFNLGDLGFVGGNASGSLDLGAGGGINLFSPQIVVQNTFAINPVTQVAQIFDQTLTTNITNVLNSVLAG